MTLEPIAREVAHALERAGLREQMRRAFDHGEPFLLAPELLERGSVEIEHLRVERPYDEQRGRTHAGECRTREIGTATARGALNAQW